MPIPVLNNIGELPPGEYGVTLDEIEYRFGRTNPKRRALMRGLRRAAENLAQAGVRKIWIDGRFVTDKKRPNDIDGVWEAHEHIDCSILDPAFFQINRDGEPKGILVVRLENNA